MSSCWLLSRSTSSTVQIVKVEGKGMCQEDRKTIVDPIYVHRLLATNECSLITQQSK